MTHSRVLLVTSGASCSSSQEQITALSKGRMGKCATYDAVI